MNIPNGMDNARPAVNGAHSVNLIRLNQGANPTAPPPKKRQSSTQLHIKKIKNDSLISVKASEIISDRKEKYCNIVLQKK